MAATHKFKVYDSAGQYVASCKYPEDAAALIACVYGDNGATIRYGHRKVVWTEGSESMFASESYDFVAEQVWKRI